MFHSKGEVGKIDGSVVLAKKSFIGFVPSIFDRLDGFLGRGIVFQLILFKDGGKSYGKQSHLEGWSNATGSGRDGKSEFKVTFEWDEEETGVPGAILVKNFHHTEFCLSTITLHHVPNHGRIHFVCNSWVYPANRYKNDRIFFTNQPYLPSQTPSSLRRCREDELENLRGKGIEERHEWDRLYDYDCYNDLGDSDKGVDFVRPILGGSSEYPYPRRIRTCRPPSKTDPKSESRVPLAMSLRMYVPRDERFSPLKMADAVAYSVKAIGPFLASELEGIDSSPNEFDKFQDVMDLYEGNFALANFPLLRKIREIINIEFFKEVLRTDNEKFLKFPTPQVIKEEKTAWRTDEEFAREMLAGLNPLVIRRLREFPPKSKLDTKLYGHQNSSIKETHIEKYLGGLTIHEAIREGRIFILDYHDTFMPYLSRINSETHTKAYATRTLLFLQDDGTLKPLAIELSLPCPEGDQFGAISRVFTSSNDGVDGSIWLLAKAYVSVNESGYHQLISHWLHTHAVIEPFIIATNRQLSVLHPIHKLLYPHFKDTMNVNALSRQILNNAGGLIEKTIFPAKFSMELTSKAYKEWSFTDQALPADLINRGMAVEDSKYPHGIRLLISDYPYAVDGLEIWSAIKCWVHDYCSLYYKVDETVKDDTELQLWWSEVRNKGHADKKDDLRWPKMDTVKAVVDSCTIIIWVASALHAAVNFGQYAYGGFPLKSPSISRELMPNPGSVEYEELKVDPEKGYLRRITSQVQTLIGMSLVEILSRHTVDELFLGQRDTLEWTADSKAMEAFGRFGTKLQEIEKRIIELNNEKRLKNRCGPVKLPYTLLFPTSEVGLTGMGIPNSISI